MLRYKLYVLLFFIVFIIGVGYVNADNNMPLFGKVIYIDPGHGGVDPGSIYKDIYEKDINLSISLKLQEKLIEKGAIVYLTRNGDFDLSVTNTINRKRSDLSRRANAINKSDCDIYLSIHLNAEASGTWRGPQVFYDDINENNALIAKILQKNLNNIYKTNRKTKEVNDLYLEKRIKRPGVLLEVGFLSNANDRYLFRQDSFIEKLCEAITNGLIDYFS